MASSDTLHIARQRYSHFLQDLSSSPLALSALASLLPPGFCVNQVTQPFSASRLPIAEVPTRYYKYRCCPCLLQLPYMSQETVSRVFDALVHAQRAILGEQTPFTKLEAFLAAQSNLSAALTAFTPLIEQNRPEVFSRSYTTEKRVRADDETLVSGDAMHACLSGATELDRVSLGIHQMAWRKDPVYTRRGDHKDLEMDGGVQSYSPKADAKLDRLVRFITVAPSHTRCKQG